MVRRLRRIIFGGRIRLIRKPGTMGSK